jgi:hypothetical protein
MEDRVFIKNLVKLLNQKHFQINKIGLPRNGQPLQQIGQGSRLKNGPFTTSGTPSSDERLDFP